MIGRKPEATPQIHAKLAGVFYLFEALMAVFGQMFVLGKLYVHGDSVATATNILRHATMFRLGFASSLIAVLLHIVWAFLFYELLKPVNKNVSFLAMLVILVGCSIQAIAGLLFAAPLTVLSGGTALESLTVEQLQALAQLFLMLNGLSFNAYLVFFGMWCALVGYLICRSTFLPRIIGVLMVVAGLGYLTLLWSPLARYLYPFNLLVAAPGEISLLLWLLLKGVNESNWKLQANV